MVVIQKRNVEFLLTNDAWVETQAEENCRYSDYWFSIRIVVLQLRGMLTKSVVLDLF